MWWLIGGIALIAVLLAFFAWRRRRWKLVLRAWVRLQGPAGHTVDLRPEQPDSDDLMAAVACFTAKLYWLLATEPPHLRPWFMNIMLTLIEGDWADRNDPAQRFLSKPSSVLLSMGFEEMPHGEIYLETLEQGRGTLFFRNTLEAGSFVETWVLANLLFLREALSRFDSTDRRIFHSVFAGVVGVLSTAEASGSDTQTLTWLFAMVKASQEMAVAQYQDV